MNNTPTDKKFELTDETLVCAESILHRIVALKDFGYVKKGTKGGWVQYVENLSQEGNCWIYGDAKAYAWARISGDAEISENAHIFGEAAVSGRAHVFGDAHIFGVAQVFGDACVYGNAHIYDDAKVFDDASVFGDAEIADDAHIFGLASICGYARIYGDARVSGSAFVCANARIYGDAVVCGDAEIVADTVLRKGITETDDDYVVIGPQGIRHSCATYHIPSDTVCTGCFVGTLKEFEAAVKKTYADNERHLKQYKRVIRVFKLYKH